MEQHQRTHWQVRRSSCLCPVSANSRIREQGGTQDWEPLIQQARQQGRRCRAYSRSEHLRETISLSRSGLRGLVPPSTTESRNVSGIGVHLPGLHAGIGSQILVLRFPHFLHEPTQNSNDLEKSTNRSDPNAGKVMGRLKEP